MTQALTPELRKQLENAVRAARVQGEAGARAALGALAVDAARPHESMSADERGLRRRLRAHGRQLGDARDRESGVQEIGRLAHEVAYEHWHRMLFARFLAETGLLVEPRSRVSVTLDECAELARETGATNGWQVAEGFAAEMLPQIFRPHDPVLAVALAPETRQRLERLAEDLPAGVFTASDALGWTYQFWQADRKDEVNRSGAKIGADELPAVTQLFTENYMVRFLFHNTIGAWRAGKVLAERPELAEGAASEAELAEAVRIEPRNGLDGYDFEYLRFVREPSGDDGEDTVEDSTGPWRPAAGAYGRWLPRASDLRVLDPCCGSGHFLVEGLELLVRLRMEEGLGVEDAVEAVLQDNLFGLEIDQRCTQIAAFNLALAAWKMVGRPVELPPLQVACTGLSVGAAKSEWLKLAEGEQALEGALDRLHDLFGQASVLGSLIDPGSVEKGLYQADYATAESALSRAIAREDADDEVRERAVAAQGMSRAAGLLAGEYDLVITNVPYLARGKQAANLQDFALKSHPDAKADLATIFVSRILRWLGGGGVQAIVAPQNWLFLTSYRKCRERLLAERTWRFVARLGEHAFESTTAAGAFAAMTVLSAGRPDDEWRMAGIDVSAPRGEEPIPAREKAELLRIQPESRGAGAPECEAHPGAADPGAVAGEHGRKPASQRDLGAAGVAFSRRSGAGSPVDEPRNPQEERGGVASAPGRVRVRLAAQSSVAAGPDARIVLRSPSRSDLLERFADAPNGMHAGDTTRFRRCYWELAAVGHDWRFFQRPPAASAHYSGREHVFAWPDDGRIHRENPKAYVKGKRVWGRSGVVMAVMSELHATLYSGDLFDISCVPLVPSSPDDLSPLWSYCSDDRYRIEVRLVDPKLNVTNATLAKIPFDLAHWRQVAAERYPKGLPEPYSDDPTQWLFHGHPSGSVVWNEETKWTAHGPLRVDASVLHVAVARLVGYRWPAELDPEMRMAAESREWVERCRGLHDFADADGIVCLQAAAGELPAADRLRTLLSAAYGEEWSAEKERELLVAAANVKRPSRSLGEWLRDRFFAEHCKLFHNRPFVWHVWDGRKDGFHALVNCHRLCGSADEGRRTLGALAYRHLGEWIGHQREAQSQGEEGADARLAAALDLQDQLELILKGEPPHDLFIRWRPLREQPAGWAPNLDDGVRLNIRPFMRAELQGGGRKGAGILRVRPNIKWGKDRGKEPENLRPREDFPWFYSCPGLGSEVDRTDYTASSEAAYDGNRWNDLHYTRAAKEAASARHEACEK